MLLDVEPKLDDVTVLDDVFFACDAKFAGLAGFGVGAERDQVLEGDGLGGEERTRRSAREQRRF